MVPSKKRTCAGRPKPSSVEKLTRDLCSILHEQQSYFSASSEEDLLFESDTPMVSVEIGHGSILIRHPSSIACDEESEASSLSVDNKQCLMNEAYSCSGTHSDRGGMNFSSHGVEKIRNSAGQIMQQEQLERDKSQHEKLQVPGNHDSPLCLIDLNDVVNYEEFMRNLTNEDQQQLLKYLPVVDTAKLPIALKTCSIASNSRRT
ncbi:GATA transcription factor 26 [Spatholobus suberectus]|nr:GATA transcription factor 26 [Spatholobus suberectus]